MHSLLNTASGCCWLCTVPLTQQVHVTGYAQSPWHSKCMFLVMQSPLDTASACYWLCTVPLTQQVYVGYVLSTKHYDAPLNTASVCCWLCTVNVAWSSHEKRCWQSISANSMISTHIATSPCYLPYVLCIIKLLLTPQILLRFGVIILCFSADHMNQYPFKANRSDYSICIQWVKTTIKSANITIIIN